MLRAGHYTHSSGFLDAANDRKDPFGDFRFSSQDKVETGIYSGDFLILGTKEEIWRYCQVKNAVRVIPQQPETMIFLQAGPQLKIEGMRFTAGGPAIISALWSLKKLLSKDKTAWVVTLKTASGGESLVNPTLGGALEVCEARGWVV